MLDATRFAAVIPAADHEVVRVSVLNPKFDAPTDPSEAHVDFFLHVDGLDGEVTVVPTGTVRFFTIEPSNSAPIPAQRSTVRSVIVSFQAVATVEGAPAPRPAVTIELVDTRTGASRIVHANTYTGITTVTDGTLY